MCAIFNEGIMRAQIRGTRVFLKSSLRVQEYHIYIYIYIYIYIHTYIHTYARIP